MKENGGLYILKTCKILNRDQIKLLAVFTMTFNHISHVLMTPGSVLSEVFEDIGYFTAMTMCFFLVEGYQYTHSKKAYAKRLLIFALISQIPYVLAVGFFQLNVLFTLLICFLILCVMDSQMKNWQKKLLLIGLILFTIICDWAIILAIAAILFKKNENSPRGQAAAYGIVTALFWFLNIPGYAPPDAAYPLLSGYAILHGFYASLGLIASAIATLVLYNGKKSEKQTNFHKWFFYIYYPAHLLVLWAIHFIQT